MPETSKARKALVARVLEGEIAASQEQHCAAFDDNALGEPVRTLVDKVVMCSSRITDADIAAAKAARLSEDQIFELVVCAAIGQATRQYVAVLAALADATEAI